MNIVQGKLLLQEEQLKFLEWVWRDLPVNFRDHYINNYGGRVPLKYSGNGPVPS